MRILHSKKFQAALTATILVPLMLVLLKKLGGIDDATVNVCAVGLLGMWTIVPAAQGAKDWMQIKMGNNNGKSC